MDPESEAERMLEHAIADQQVARAVDPDLVPRIRSAVRRQARERGVEIRTGMIDGVLVVIMADADLWHER